MTGTDRANQVLESLLVGNHRYVSAARFVPDETLARRQELVAGQHPRAAILGCADSRVPPEIIFDQGLGSLFVVRVAGNFAGPETDSTVVGSLQYAVAHLHVPLLLVLGHSGCGAVAAAVQGSAEPGRLGALVAALQPAVEQARGEPGPLLENAVAANVRLVVESLRTTVPVFATAVAAGQLAIVGAVYDLASGKVTLFE